MRSSTDDVMVPASTSEHASGPHFASDHLRSRPAHDYRDEEDSQSEDEEEHGRGHGDSHHHYYSGTHPLLQEGQPFLPSGPSGDRSASPAGKLNGRRTPLKWSEVLWVLATSLLIAVLAYSSQIFVIWPYYRKTDTFTLAQLLTLLLPFNASILVLFYNYYLCVTTNPGDVPRGWEPDWSALDLDPHPHPHPAAAIRAADTNGRGAATLELKSYAHKPRYCRSCSSYKPPRSHHCKTCGKCVLRMDHHCPWVANCVGFHNHAHFLRFLFAVDVSCTWHLAMLSLRVLDRWNTYGYWREPSGGEVLALVLNYALCIPVLLLVGMFSLYHFYCLAINQTTIESWEKDKVATLIRRGKVRKVRYPYNVSVRSNVGAVLGRNPLLWCVPQRMQGDGLVYEVADGIDPSAQYRWPPKDPARQRAAPSLFPGASAEPSVSPFTYGTGFNPSLVPTSSTLRRRGAGPLANGASQDGHGSSRSEDGTSVSSGSDEDVPLYRGEGAWGVARREEEGELQRWYDDDDDDGEDEDEEEGEDGDGGDGRGRVRVRRGSEGYEVRPAVDRWAVPQPEGREYYERVRLPSEVVAARLIG